MIRGNKGIAVGIAGLLLIIGITAALFAQTPADTPAKPGKKKNFDVTADKMRVTWGNDKKVLLSGNVVFTQEDIKIMSEYVEWDRTQETATFPKKVSIIGKNEDATAAKGQAFFKKRIGILEGDVVLNIKQKEEANAENKESSKDSVREGLKKDTLVTCNKLEYDYKNKISVATGQVTIKQKDRTVTSDKVVFDQKNELLTLNGNVKIVDEEGQEFTTPGEARISIKKGDEWIEAPNLSAKFKINIDEE